jgi:hypothetical protein
MTTEITVGDIQMSIHDPEVLSSYVLEVRLNNGLQHYHYSVPRIRRCPDGPPQTE